MAHTKKSRSRSRSRAANASPRNESTVKVASKPTKSRASTLSLYTAEDILLFFPNIIGYARVVFMLLALYFAQSDWKKCLSCYCVAFGGDVVDGWVARRFNQSSAYGGTLDMVTDRVSTTGFLVVLASLMSQHALYFSLLAVLDIASHWFHMVSISVGAGHKSEEALRERNAILKWYYGIYVLFGYCCVGAEFFYIFLYVYHFTSSPMVLKLALYLCGPACALKNVINVVQMCSACYAIAENDAEVRNSNNITKSSSNSGSNKKV